MNGRTSKLMGHIGTALRAAGDKTPLARLKRKLKREWNSKSSPARGRERLALIRALVTAHGA